MKRHESSEDYLETILVLKKKLGDVRSIDIVNDMGFSKPSVSIAMKNLREKGMITMETNGHITLTKEGLEIAERVFERHTILTKTLLALGVSEETARKDACRMEHDISDETFNKLKEKLEENK